MDHYFERSSLSKNEIKEFKDIMKNDKNLSSKNLYTHLSFLEIFNYLNKNREKLAEKFSFNSDEILPINSLAKSDLSKEGKAICFHFIFTILDHKFIVENYDSLDEILIGKLLFLLGITEFKNFLEISNQTVLFKLILFLKNYNYYAYNTIDKNEALKHLAQCNTLLSNIASVLTISACDRFTPYNSDSLHIDCTIKGLSEKDRFSLFISSLNTESKEFKYAYDFYFKRQVKPELENIISEIDDEHNPLIQKDTTLSKFEKMIIKYKRDLKGKFGDFNLNI